MIKIKFEILGKEWRLRVLKRKKYAKKNGADSLGMTKSWKRTIDLTMNGVDLETITHELVHAYFAEMCVSSSTEMTVADLEEFFAELLAKRGRELLDLADLLFTKAKQLTEPKVSE